ncbi:odorant receptor Or2-like [Vespa mandarinia]|uniref:odorant receptor Or2-like n=1 Tax=Vespa mandarinia TaxID=7446 RepID=UPI0016194D3B|nr:odorant receptor Or2-like [Vespa mandarinia]
MEMENIVKQAAPYEKAILEKYVKRCAILHISLTFGFYLAGTNIVLGPIFLSQSLPTFAVYPFDTESHPIYEIIYFQQALTAIQACTAAAIDCLAALLLWFAGARFEMLKAEFANIVDEYDLTRCIQKHRHILSYAEKIVKTVRFVILATVAITTILIVFSGTDSMTIKFQFFVLDIVAIIQLFLNSHPAENLIQMSTAIGSAAYDLNWIDKSLVIWKNVCFLIQRSQKPITLSIPGFIPALSLTYYMSYRKIIENYPILPSECKRSTKNIVFSSMHNGIQNQKCIVIYCYSIIAFSNYKITCKKELIGEKVLKESLIFFVSNNLKELQIRKIHVASGTNIVLGPIFLSQSLPTFAVYPFDTESHPIYEIIYFQQAFTCIQACTGATIDCQVALLLWFAGARFEMLEIEVANIVDEYDLKRCIVKHGQILRYAGNIVKTVRFVIFSTVFITTILISDSVAVKFQFLVLDIVAIVQLFLNSYPAENLIEMSTAIGSAVYDLNWIDKSRKIWKNVCFLIQRSQKPITVSIPGFIPALSLTYYMSFLSSSFSYFTTLRAAVK